MTHFSIGFEKHKEGADDHRLGRIAFGDMDERFSSCLSLFSENRYELQWFSAVQLTVHSRSPTCLFYSIEVDENPLGIAKYYTLIPSEQARGSTRYDNNSEGVYLTESFRTIAFDPKYLTDFQVYIDENGCVYDKIAIYYFDPDNIEIFYLYLDTCISNVSNWYINNSALFEWLASKGRN